MNNSVLIICTSLNMGGSEKQAVWLANKLIEENKKVYFVSLKDISSSSTNPLYLRYSPELLELA